MKDQKSNPIFLTSIITAFTASLCCISPVLALIAGTSGMASTFLWLEPFRPWLISLTMAVLGFAWYRKFKPSSLKEADCACEPARPAGEDNEKPPFLHSKRFLAIVTVFAVLMLAFPAYADIFFPRYEKGIAVVDKNDMQKAEFVIEGMTCTGCEAHVEHEVNQLHGVITAEASYEDGNAIVSFDNSLTTPDSIEAAILKTGYKITETKIF